MTDEDMLVAGLGNDWYQAKRGMGQPHLPYKGGTLDQPAALMDAIKHCAGVAAAFTKAQGDDGGGGRDPMADMLRRMERGG